MSACGATRTCRNVRHPVAIGWQAEIEEAVRNKLDVRVRALTNGPGAPVSKFPASHIEFLLERIGGHGALIIDWLDAAPLDAVALGQLADRIVAFLRARREVPHAHDLTRTQPPCPAGNLGTRPRRCPRRQTPFRAFRRSAGLHGRSASGAGMTIMPQGLPRLSSHYGRR